MTKFVYHYPAGHANEGEIVAVFHEAYGPDGNEVEPPAQNLPDGTTLGLSKEADSALPDPPNFDPSNWKVDVSKLEAYKP